MELPASVSEDEQICSPWCGLPGTPTKATQPDGRWSRLQQGAGSLRPASGVACSDNNEEVIALLTGAAADCLDQQVESLVRAEVAYGEEDPGLGRMPSAARASAWESVQSWSPRRCRDGSPGGERLVRTHRSGAQALRPTGKRELP